MALAVAVVLFAVVTAQTGALARALAARLLVYLGTISYGVYLWHFPLFALLDAERMHLYGLPLLAVRFAATLVVATASFYLVERPIRRGRMSTLAEWRGWLATAGAFLGVVAVTVAATLPVGGRGRRDLPLACGTTGRRAAGAGGGAGRLGRLAPRVRPARPTAPQQSYGVDIDNGAIVGVRRRAQHRVRGPRRAGPDGRPVQPGHRPPPSGPHSGRGTSPPSTRTWS